MSLHSIPKNSTSKQGNTMIIVLVSIAALIGLGAYTYFTNFAANTPNQPAPSESSTMVPDDALIDGEDNSPTIVVDEMGVKTITLEAGSFYFTPNEIRVQKGDRVRIIMNSVDMMHDFNIDELEVKIPVTSSGNSNSVEFTADTAGQFEFYCDVSQHRLNGQTGLLIVEE